MFLFSDFISCGLGLAVFGEQMLVVRGDLTDGEDFFVFKRGAILVSKLFVLLFALLCSFLQCSMVLTELRVHVFNLILDNCRVAEARLIDHVHALLKD